MTLGEMEITFSEGCSECIGAETALEAGIALRDVLIRAKTENRLTCGVYQAAKKLDVDPERVMLCIHADLCMENVPLQLHFALMEAFCWENQIKLLKVGDTEALRQLCEDVPLTSDEEAEEDAELSESQSLEPSPWRHQSEDFSCILVEVPEKMDAACHTLLAHYMHLSEAETFPHVTLAT
ncbi:growth arrest and DNA damage-inducible protein GADD45 alpha-like [Diadema setosum]|uniref:growth arrest and DNA damage-inducible protein GADD45 alpha-like n=1 Tax=Diadema setosum TaxID=31175 RepID=UPI003B3A7BBE